LKDTARVTQEAGADHVVRQLRLLADGAHEHAILFLDRDGLITWWSKGAERVFSIPSAQAIGMPLSRIFTDTDESAGISTLERLMAECDAISEDDRWHVRADGSRFWSSGSMIALREDGGEIIGFGKILRDRTDIKEHMLLLENRIAEAQLRERAKDAALTTLSHELRNVFAGLTYGLQMNETASDMEGRRRIAQLMKEQLDVVQRLTEDLLDAKRLATGKASITLQRTVVQEILEQVLANLRPKYELKMQAVQFLPASAPIIVAADPVRLVQIFTNLIDNAIKYTPGGGRIWVKATLEDRDAVVHVEDNGKGIPPDMLTRIFDMFTQVDTTASSSGLGIGLALVHELVQLHGGSVQAVSKGVGMGSEFTVRIPLANEL
jgi:PAS domain S-box-containing protein